MFCSTDMDYFKGISELQHVTKIQPQNYGFPTNMTIVMKCTKMYLFSVSNLILFWMNCLNWAICNCRLWRSNVDAENRIDHAHISNLRSLGLTFRFYVGLDTHQAQNSAVNKWRCQRTKGRIKQILYTGSTGIIFISQFDANCVRTTKRISMKITFSGVFKKHVKPKKEKIVFQLHIFEFGAAILNTQLIKWIRAAH